MTVDDLVLLKDRLCTDERSPFEPLSNRISAAGRAWLADLRRFEGTVSPRARALNPGLTRRLYSRGTPEERIPNPGRPRDGEKVATCARCLGSVRYPEGATAICHRCGHEFDPETMRIIKAARNVA